MWEYNSLRISDREARVPLSLWNFSSQEVSVGGLERLGKLSVGESTLSQSVEWTRLPSGNRTMSCTELSWGEQTWSFGAAVPLGSEQQQSGWTKPVCFRLVQHGKIVNGNKKIDLSADLVSTALIYAWKSFPIIMVVILKFRYGRSIWEFSSVAACWEQVGCLLVGCLLPFR